MSRAASATAALRIRPGRYCSSIAAASAGARAGRVAVTADHGSGDGQNQGGPHLGAGLDQAGRQALLRVPDARGGLDVDGREGQGEADAQQQDRGQNVRSRSWARCPPAGTAGSRAPGRPARSGSAAGRRTCR